MNSKQITAELDRLQALLQPPKDAIELLSNLVGSHEGPLFDAVGRLVDEVIRSVAINIGADRELLSDWWLTHEFGAKPMQAGFVGEPLRTIDSNAMLAAFIAENARASA